MHSATTSLNSESLHTGQAAVVLHKKWKEHPSHVPSGQFGGSNTAPAESCLGSQRKVMMVRRPSLHAGVGLVKYIIQSEEFLEC